jgi:L-alanine-DL-glutamate epimerase-like enolase superfamily enzyme
LQKQLSRWAEQGFERVKMKIGRDPKADPERVRAAREAIGDSVQLYVDANGAYTRKQALAMADGFAKSCVSWFEEPVSSQDLEGLHLIRDRAPAEIKIAAGEYGYDPVYFRRMLEAEAVDVLQADATRCLGITGFVQAAALCEAHCLPLSAHTAPTIHTHVACAIVPAYDVEYFHDHARIEQMLFDGAAVPKRGRLVPDLSRPGFGIELKRADAERFAA